MTRVRKTGLGFLALLCALTLGFALAGCGSKDTEPTYGYGEEGTYYYSASDDTDYVLTLRQGTYILTFGTEGQSGTYEYSEGTLTLYSGGEEEPSTGTMTDSGISLTYDGRSYLFLRYEYYTVSFTDGGTTLSTQSVLNGKAAQDPGEPEKDGYVFLGWYTDSAFTTRYEFNTSITGNTTIYARFVRVEGATEYKITYDFGNGETSESETLNGRIYDLPEAESSGQTFIGWWVSATNSADELTYRYDGETLCEDTTLFAVFASGSYIGASIKDDGIYWENYNAAVTDVILRDESGAEMDRFTIQSTDQEYSYDFSSLPAGKYFLVIEGGGIDETLVYVSNGLSRASGFTIVSGSILMYGEVPGAERYYISIDCGTEGHDHSYIDNGTSLYYDFSSCEMPSTGITFTVYAYAEGYYYSVSSYNYFLGLDRVTVTVENGEVTWERVALAQEYEVYIDGTLVATTSDTSWSLSGYGTGTYEIAVKPITTGYYSEMSETITFTKTTLASPEITGIDDYTITWTPVEGATGYTVSINGTETTISGGDITSLILSDENYTEGLDSYEISVKALAPDSANDSPYGETITVTGTSVGSAVSYDNGTVTWQYSLSATEYRITVNDGDELIVIGTNSSPITLTKSGNNEITIYFVNDYNEIYGTAEITVYAYAIVFDARGGTAYDADGNEIDTIYVAKGDAVTLPEADRGVIKADFAGWYTLPDMTDDPDATVYQGDGVLFEDGAVFNGNSTIVLYAFWLNPRMVVSLDPAGGILMDEDGNGIYEIEIAFNGRNYTVAVPETTDGAYVFYGWYSGENGTGTRYTDENGDALRAFSDEKVTTLYARWIEALSFSTTTSPYDGSQVLAVSKGSDIGLLSEVTIPDRYTYNGTEYSVEVMSGSAFSSCSALAVINIPDTMKSLNITNNGYDSGTGIFASTPLTDVNVYATGEPSTTREIIYYSDDGVLYQKTDSGDAELFYYPYGRTDPTYEIPKAVQNENEYELNGNRETAVVRDVTSIGNSAFRGHAELTFMSIPEHITSIGTYTFYNCTSLESVYIEADVARLGDYMFYGCSSLTEADIPDTVTELGDQVFRNCTSLKTAVLPDSVTATGTYVFAGCTALENATLSNGLTVINDRMFYQCSSLRGIEIPYGVTAINQYVFYQCTSLVAAPIPSSVTTLGNYAFAYCSALPSIDIPDTVTSMGTYCFDGCSAATSLHIPEGLTSISNYCFRNCNALEKLTIPESVTSIGQYAFQYCWSLTSVTIPSGVESIGSNAFQYCYRLVEVLDETPSLGIAVGSSSTNGYIGSNAYNVYTPTEGESHLSYVGEFLTVYDADGNRYLVDYEGDETDVVLPDDIYGHTYAINQYAFYSDGSIRSVTISSGVTSIGGYAFASCASLRDVDISYGITEIGLYAFNGDASLAAMDMPDSVVSVGQNSFQNCASLSEVTLGAGVSSIGSNAFLNCYRLVEIHNRSSIKLTAGSSDYGNLARYAKNIYYEDGGSHIIDVGDYRFVYDDDGYYFVGYYGDDADMVLPDGVAGNDYAILDYAFYGSTSVRSIVMPGSVTRIGTYAFYNCTSLETVILSEGLEEIGEYAFYGCKALESIDIPDSVRTVGQNAFQNCTSLESAVIGSNVADIPIYMFYACSSLKSVVIPNSAASIGNYAFYNCSALESAVIGSGVGSIGSYAFYGCSSLKSAAIPNSVTTVATYAFYNCTRLRSLTIGGSVVSIDGNAFRGCSSLLSVKVPDSCESIGTYAFYGCTALASISLGTGLTSIGTYAFQDTAYYDDESNWEGGLLYIDGYLIKAETSVEGTLRVKDGTRLIAGYALQGCNKVTWVTLPDSVRSICTYAFSNCTAMEGIDLGKGLETIETYAFYGCTSLKAIALPDSMETVGQYAFYNCSKLETLDLGNGVAVISMYAFYGCSALRSVVIPDSVTDMQGYAFYNCSALESVTIGSGVRSIGDYTFYKCTSLKAISVPDNVTSIGIDAFYGCTALESVSLGDGLTTLGQSAFDRCSSLMSIVIPDSVTTVGNYTFRDCTSLKSVVIGSGVDQISDYMFDGCSAIESFVVPVNVTVIGMYAFRDCTSLSEIVIEENVTEIGQYAFYRCASLESFVIPDSVETLGAYAFRECTSLESVTIGSSVTELGNYTFYGCTSLKSIVVPDSVAYIRVYVFYGCTQMETVDLGHGVEEIGNYAFYNCTSLESIVIPSSCTTLGTNVFQNCTSLSDIAIESDNAEIGRYSFDNTAYYNDEDNWEEGLLYIGGYLMLGETNFSGEAVVKDGTKVIVAYAFYNDSYITGITIPDSVEKIGKYAFYGCSSLGTLTLGSGLKEIGNYAFYKCTELKSLVIPDSVETIGTYAFYQCSALETVTIGGGLSEIPGYLFYGCSSLKSIDIPDTVSSIGTYAFYNCTSLTSITIGTGVTSIGRYAFSGTGYYNDASNWENGVLYIGTYLIAAETTVSGKVEIKEGTTLIGGYAFYGCSSVTGVSVPDSVKKIDQYAFYNCSAMESVEIGKNVTEIGTYAFYACSKLGGVTIPDAVESIGADTFYNCSGLTDITFGKGLAEIGNYAFYGCSTLKSIALPDSLRTIGDYAFRNCLAMDGAELGNGVTSIGRYAFYGCSALITISIPDSVTQMGTEVFYGCTHLSGIVLGNGLTEIPDYTFYSCEALAGITIPGSVKSIGQYAFYGCTAMKSISVPDSVESIGSYAFYRCTHLESIVIGSGTTEISNGAFHGCDALAKVYYNGTEAGWTAISIDTSDNSAILETATIYFYSENQPGSSGNFWHWVDGKVTVW